MKIRWQNLVLVGTAALPLSPIVWEWGLWPDTHEGARYFILLDLFRNAIQHGVWYPRWLPDLFGGYGYPLFCFYQPGFFFFSLPFSFLPGYPVTAILTALCSFFAIGSAGIYKLCKEIAGPEAALPSAVLFLFTPYLYVNLYVRGDLSELAAMLLCSWPLYFLLKWGDRERRGCSCVKSMIRLSLSLAGVIYFHPANALFLIAVFSILALRLAVDLKKPARDTDTLIQRIPANIPFLLQVSISAGLALALSSPYWWTVFQMREFVHLDWAFQSNYRVQDHFVHYPQFFDPTWGFGGSNPGSIDGMSFQLGLIHFSFATLGAILARKSGMVITCYALYLCAILMMTPISALLWEKIELLRMVQFPWRLLSITAILQSICIAPTLGVFANKVSKIIYAASAIVSIGVVLLWHGEQFSVRGALDVQRELYQWRKEQKYETLQTLTSAQEFLPVTVKRVDTIRPRSRFAPMLNSSHPGTFAPLSGNSAYRLRYRLVLAEPGHVRIEQLYLPGWKVVLDDIAIPRLELERNLSMDGRMIVPMAAGIHVLEATYEGPPGWRKRNVLVGIYLVLFLGYWMWQRRRLVKAGDLAREKVTVSKSLPDR